VPYVYNYLLLVLPYRELSIYFLYDIEDDGYDDEEGGAADSVLCIAGDDLHDVR
jgi:hypothetical protein